MMDESHICPNPDLCQVLNRHIHGRLYDIWQGTVLTPPKCEAYRQKWLADAGLESLPEHLAPTILQRAANYTKAVVTDVASGRRRLTPDELNARLAVCNDCSLLTTKRVCSHMKCGCVVERKARWRSQDCPLGKWPQPALSTEQPCV